MDSLIEQGKKQTQLVAIFLILVSIYSTINYHFTLGLDSKKLTQQIIRLLLTVGLLFFVYRGKTWARTILLICLSLGILVSIFNNNIPLKELFSYKPIMVLVVIYVWAIGHFGFAKSYKAFATYQKELRQMKDNI